MPFFVWQQRVHRDKALSQVRVDCRGNRAGSVPAVRITPVSGHASNPDGSNVSRRDYGEKSGKCGKSNYVKNQ